MNAKWIACFGRSLHFYKLAELVRWDPVKQGFLLHQTVVISTSNPRRSVCLRCPPPCTPPPLPSEDIPSAGLDEGPRPALAVHWWLAHRWEWEAGKTGQSWVHASCPVTVSQRPGSCILGNSLCRFIFLTVIY